MTEILFYGSIIGRKGEVSGLNWSRHSSRVALVVYEIIYERKRKEINLKKKKFSIYIYIYKTRIRIYYKKSWWWRKGVEQQARPDGPAGLVRLGVPPKDTRCSDKPTRSTPPTPVSFGVSDRSQRNLFFPVPRPIYHTLQQSKPNSGTPNIVSPTRDTGEAHDAHHHPLIFGPNEAVANSRAQSLPTA